MKLVKLKLIAVLVVVSGCLAVVGACRTKTTPPPPSGATQLTSSPSPEGTKPPHAVDTSGMPLPESSTTMPDKPLILANDSNDPEWGGLMSKATFDHVKHSSDGKHSADGKTVTVCVECHHTEQPRAPAGREYLTKFERNEPLTDTQLKESKQPVKSCRVCHFQVGTKQAAKSPDGVKYPTGSNKASTGRLTNYVAYHTKCMNCHQAAHSRDSNVNPPLKCEECHVKR